MINQHKAVPHCGGEIKKDVLFLKVHKNALVFSRKNPGARTNSVVKTKEHAEKSRNKSVVQFKTVLG